MLISQFVSFITQQSPRRFVDMVKSTVNSKVNNLERILSKSYREKIKVLEENYSLLTAPGEHYGSVMLAIETKIKRGDGKEEKKHLVAKLLPVNDLLRLAFDIYVTFKKEVVAYTQAIPALVEFQQENNVSKEKYMDNFFPKCYGARVSLNDETDKVDDDGVLIFENLKVQGYKTEDRLVGFDLDSAKIVVRDLATIHATPIALKLLKPKVFEEKIRPSLTQYKGFEVLPAEVGQSFHNIIMETAKDIEELQPYLADLQKVVDYFAVHPFVDRPAPTEPWGTMQHSDYWVSNTMLLRDESGKAISNKMVDLQFLCYSTAPRDLLFFLFTSVINSVLDKHFDELIKIYYDSFIDTIRDYNLDLTPFSWESFQNELNITAPNEIYHVLLLLKPICTEKDKIVHTAEEFVESDWSRKDLLGPNYRRKLRDTVIAFAKRNWLGNY